MWGGAPAPPKCVRLYGCLGGYIICGGDPLSMLDVGYAHVGGNLPSPLICIVL